MGLLSRIRSMFTPTRGKRVKASYDAAQSGVNPEQDNHWAWTDSLNANAAADPSTRRVLRERARYECANNGYAGGLVNKLANDLIGTCPRLQLTIPGVDRAVPRRVEKAFAQWCRDAGLGAKLRLLDRAAVVDGEGFGVLCTNPALPSDGVQLDLRLYETDQVDTPFFLAGMDPLAFPGGRLDEFGNVTEWHFLKTHPGSDIWVANYLDHDPLPAADVVHWFRPTRPGQLRGVPEITSALTLYAYLRRYTLATVAAAETAANVAGVLETDLPSTEADPDAAGDQIPVQRNTLLTLPANHKLSQLKAEQPVTGYGEFKEQVLTETGAGLLAPQNIATSTSANYNYSSGRLDHGIYHRGIAVRREDLRCRVLDKVFRAWLDEAALVPGLIPDGLPLRSAWSWAWYYDGFYSLDPQKDAATDALRLANGTTTYAEVFAARGLDWEEAFEQQQIEQQRRADLGLPRPAVKARRRRREVSRAG